MIVMTNGAIKEKKKRKYLYIDKLDIDMHWCLNLNGRAIYLKSKVMVEK